MIADQNNSRKGSFDTFVSAVSNASGSTPAIMLSFICITGWFIAGPFFHYSANWQLIASTSTSVITFLMVFVIQKAQNKDSLAIQLKLNELVAAHEFASNRLVNVEDMTEDELKVIQKYYSKLKDFTNKEGQQQQSHSIDEDTELHNLKSEMEKELDDKLKSKS
jgi:low affinity Fe/Cu permease